MAIFTMARFVAPVLLCAAGAAQASDQDDLQVMGSRAATVAAWRAAVANDISANLSAPRSVIGTPLEGVVQVVFRADPTRRVDQVGISTTSGSPALDRAAVAAVNRMRTVRAAPAGVDPSRPVRAWVYFAGTQAAADRMEARLSNRAPRGLAAEDGSLPGRTGG